LGSNDAYAATQLHLNATAWKTANKQSSSSFLTWVKSNTISKYPVIIGVYTNENKFYGSTDANAGDPDYDHIVTVIGLSSKAPLNNPATYYSDDILQLSDHGLWTDTSKNLPQYIFNFPFGSFQGKCINCIGLYTTAGQYKLRYCNHRRNGSRWQHRPCATGYEFQ
jgi:hypothetical protein